MSTGSTGSGIPVSAGSSGSGIPVSTGSFGSGRKTLGFPCPQAAVALGAAPSSFSFLSSLNSALEAVRGFVTCEEHSADRDTLCPCSWGKGQHKEGSEGKDVNTCSLITIWAKKIE